MRQFLPVIFFLLGFSLGATHLVGGNFRVEQTSANDFDVELIIFRDRSGVSLQNSYTVMVYTASDSVLFSTFRVSRRSRKEVKLGDGCFTPVGLNFEEYIYEGSVVLPDLPEGYLLIISDCCRNSRIENAQITQDMLGPVNYLSYTALIPNPALPGLYHSPDLGLYPQTGYFCINDLQSTDLSATDADGDSLAYELAVPLDSIIQSDTLKLEYLKYANGYSQNDIIGGPSPLTLDPITGMLTGQPSQKGVFVFSYLVKEYRNGELIGEIRRDIQFHTVNCKLNRTPLISEPAFSVQNLRVKEESCFRVSAIDSNSGDSLWLITRITDMPDYDAGKVRHVALSGTGSGSGQFCYTPSCLAAFAEDSIPLQIQVISYGCSGPDTAREELHLIVEGLPGQLRDIIPNIFTPNNDGVNDRLQLKNTDVIPCLENFELKIFNRWGVMVYEASLSDPDGWDGEVDQAPAAQGVYFYTIESKYRGVDAKLQGHLTLMR